MIYVLLLCAASTLDLPHINIRLAATAIPMDMLSNTAIAECTHVSKRYIQSCRVTKHLNQWFSMHLCTAADQARLPSPQSVPQASPNWQRGELWQGLQACQVCDLQLCCLPVPGHASADGHARTIWHSQPALKCADSAAKSS